MYFVSVNLAIIWLVAPISAYVAKKTKNRAMSMGLTSFMIINSLTHIIAMFSQGYNPGLGSVVLVFLPISLWAIFWALKEKHINLKTLFALLGVGGLVHIFLILSIALLSKSVFLACITIVSGSFFSGYLWYKIEYKLNLK